MNIVIIIPTYNEAENIKRLVPALVAQCAQIPHEVHILVVDDSSPDGTGAAVEGLRHDYPCVTLITGTKEGLGKAYIRGMTYAMNTMHADAVMEMDADFSHDPADVPRLIEQLAIYDFVIGSRYVPGGSIPENWGALRKANSKYGNITARFIAGIYPVHDCTAGFRAIKTSILRKIALQEFDVTGYCFQIKLLYHARAARARICEVPVHFIDRTAGESKLGIKDIVEFLLQVWAIRLDKNKTFVRFLMVGASGVCVNLGVLALCLRLGLNEFIASPISIELSIIWNFLINNYWTFGHRVLDDKVHIRGLKCNIVSVLALGVSYGTFVALMLCIDTVNVYAAQFLGIIPATIINYVLNSYWTFKGKRGN